MGGAIYSTALLALAGSNGAAPITHGPDGWWADGPGTDPYDLAWEGTDWTRLDGRTRSILARSGGEIEAAVALTTWDTTMLLSHLVALCDVLGIDNTGTKAVVKARLLALGGV